MRCLHHLAWDGNLFGPSRCPSTKNLAVRRYGSVIPDLLLDSKMKKTKREFLNHITSTILAIHRALLVAIQTLILSGHPFTESTVNCAVECLRNHVIQNEEMKEEETK